VPELLKRLKELQARGEEERERIRSVFRRLADPELFKLDLLPDPYCTFDQIKKKFLWRRFSFLVYVFPEC
jgi:hypothetical protein